MSAYPFHCPMNRISGKGGRKCQDIEETTSAVEEVSTEEEGSVEVDLVSASEAHSLEGFLGAFSEMRFNLTDMAEATVEDTHHMADIPRMATIHTHTRLITAPMDIGKQKRRSGLKRTLRLSFILHGIFVPQLLHQDRLQRSILSASHQTCKQRGSLSVHLQGT